MITADEILESHLFKHPIERSYLNLSAKEFKVLNESLRNNTVKTQNIGCLFKKELKSTSNVQEKLTEHKLFNLFH